MSAESKALIFEKMGYVPTEGQIPVHFTEARIKEVVGGIRSGKSTVGGAEIIGDYGHGNLYWLLGSDYEMCREEFNYIVDWAHILGIVQNCHYPSRDQCRLILEPDIVIETKSAKYPEKIAAKAVRGILMCEAAQMSYDIFLRCIERLTQLDGFLIATGTLETSLDWYSDKWKEYQIPGNTDGGASFSLPSWSNLKIFPGGRQDPKILKAEAILGKERFSERYGGVPIKPKGIVLPEFKTTLHTGHYPVNWDVPIYIGVDPGYDPGVYSVLFLQFIADHIFVVAEIYEQMMGTEQIIAMTNKKPYFKLIEGGAIDIAAKQHHGQKPVWDIWSHPPEPYFGVRLDSRRIKPINDGVNKLRQFMIPHPITHEVQLHIDSSCRGLISELGGCKPPSNIDGGGVWRRKMDKAGNVLSEEPDEKHCHSAKALIYAVVSRYGLGGRQVGPGATRMKI